MHHALRRSPSSVRPGNRSQKVKQVVTDTQPEFSGFVPGPTSFQLRLPVFSGSMSHILLLSDNNTSECERATLFSVWFFPQKAWVNEHRDMSSL